MWVCSSNAAEEHTGFCAWRQHRGWCALIYPVAIPPISASLACLIAKVDMRPKVLKVWLVLLLSTYTQFFSVAWYSWRDRLRPFVRYRSPIIEVIPGYTQSQRSSAEYFLFPLSCDRLLSDRVPPFCALFGWICRRPFHVVDVFSNLCVASATVMSTGRMLSWNRQTCWPDLTCGAARATSGI